MQGGIIVIPACLNKDHLVEDFGFLALMLAPGDMVMLDEFPKSTPSASWMHSYQKAN